ncbi:MAG TPA: Maf family protein, partial [Terriglobales bacterium]|nr:Maf family protein [Terriglobales bacterium]
MLVLASASPRRQELLRRADIAFTAYPTNVAELPQTGESGRDCAERLAREKTLAAYHGRRDDFVLGADTIVVVEG